MTLNIPDFSDCRVLVAGDAMLDEYWFGDTARISPEAPVPVVRTRNTEERPGGAANVALNLSDLGAQVTLAAAIGRDAAGKSLRAILEDRGVECRFVQSEALRTPHKLRVLARNQQLIRLDSEESLAAAVDEFAALFAEEVGRHDVVVFSDYGKGTLAGIADLIRLAHEGGCATLVDPKGSDFERYRGVGMLTPNAHEFTAVAGPFAGEAGFHARAAALLDELDLGALLVTRGSEGMTLFRPGAEPFSLLAEAREVFDVTGAGDTVIALLAASVAAGLDLEDAAGIANLGAGLVVAKIGVASLTPAELKFALHRRGRGGRGLVGIDELAELVAAAKLRGSKVVMTNGCFDILHAGHVSYLEEAKTLGDHLIVAVNDDESVRRLKGAERPIMPLADRMAVLAGLAAVDWVVAFSDDTPKSLIERIVPDVLVKGGDWSPADIVGSDTVLASGGSVRSLSYKDGRSTTEVIERIRSPSR